MIESLHHVIDQLTGIFLTLLGEVEIEHDKGRWMRTLRGWHHQSNG
jgi:hypothetical protein